MKELYLALKQENELFYRLLALIVARTVALEAPRQGHVSDLTRDC